MAFISGIGTTITNNYTAIGSDKFYLIEQGETLIGDVAPAFNFDTSDNNTLIVRGTVSGTIGSAVVGSVGAELNQIRVASDGLVTGTTNAVLIYGASSELRNRGQIAVSDSAGFAVVMGGDGSLVNNSGTITGGSRGVVVGDANNATVDSYTIINSGRISADNIGALASGSFNVTIENSGLIRSDYMAIGLEGDHARIENDGRIVGGPIGIYNSAAEMQLFNNEGGVIKSRPVASSNAQDPMTPALLSPAAYQGGVNTDSIVNAGTFVGDVSLGSGDDSYVGLGTGWVAGVVEGGAGLDVLTGSRASDTLSGGIDNDAINGRGGNDSLFGDEGSDVMAGGAGRDRMFGGSGDDWMSGGGGNDWMVGEDGNDVLHAGAGNDTLYGGAGLDTLNGETGDDLIHGEGGDDTIFGEDGADSLYGDDGGDWLQGDGGDDLIVGGAGTDILIGGAGADTLRGGANDDFLYGDGENDKLYGGTGADELNGGAGNDKLFGGADPDVLYGGTGNDVLRGQGGDDTLYSDTGNDRLIGGAGADVFDFAVWFDDLGTNRILDFENGIDKIVLAGFGVDTVELALGRALSQSGSNVVIDLDLLNPDTSAPQTGLLVIVGAWGQIDASDFII